MADNIETVKSMYAAFGRGDIAEVMSHVADDVLWEFEAPASITWSGIRRGRQEALGFFVGIDEQLKDMTLAMTEFFAEGDRAASFGRFQGTSKATGKRLDTPVAHFWRFRGGQVAEYRNIINSAAVVEAISGSAAAVA